MERSLYGSDGYFRKNAPATQFRTSVHASPLFAVAIASLVRRVDFALRHPPQLDIVDIGAGRGELLVAVKSIFEADGEELDAMTPSDLHARIRFTAVEIADRPADLPHTIDWAADVPPHTAGLLIATEWLDNVPLDVVARDSGGVFRLVNTDGTVGSPADATAVKWLRRWWPVGEVAEPGDTDTAYLEPGHTRDEAWRAATAQHTGLALAVDYGHTLADRPTHGTLTGYRDGRQVLPQTDGSTDITAHVAMDSLAGENALLLRQRDALRHLGISGARPPLTLASTDPRRYMAELSRASQAAELTDLSGLGAHWWLMQWLLQGAEGDVRRFWDA